MKRFQFATGMIASVLICLGTASPALSSSSAAAARTGILSAMADHRLSVKDVRVSDDAVEVEYHPSGNTMDDLTRQWIFIFATALEQAGWVKDVRILCCRDGAPAVEITAKTVDIVGYLIEKLDASAFAQQLTARTIGKGPPVTPAAPPTATPTCRHPQAVSPRAKDMPSVPSEEGTEWETVVE